MVTNLEALARTETERKAALSKAKSDAEIRAIFKGHTYNKPESKK